MLNILILINILTLFANNFVECDEVVITCSDLTTNDIVGNSMTERESGDSEREDDDVDCSSRTKDCVALSKEALSNTKNLKKYLFQENNVPETFYTVLNNSEALVSKNTLTTLQKKKILILFLLRNKVTLTADVNAIFKKIRYEM